jgi:LysM repeat protein
MKRIAIFAVGFALVSGFSLRAQDAATEERFNRLTGQIEDLRSSQEALGKRMDAIVRELEGLRGKLDKPSGNFASEEDLKSLAEAVKEIDRKRLEDYEKIRTELRNLGRSLASTSAAPTPAARKTAQASVADATSSEKNATTTPDKVFEYQVKKGDNLSLIVKAYRDNNIKVTMDQVIKANPGLKPESLRVGQKILIPAPTS